MPASLREIHRVCVYHFVKYLHTLILTIHLHIPLHLNTQTYTSPTPAPARHTHTLPHPHLSSPFSTNPHLIIGQEASRPRELSRLPSAPRRGVQAGVRGVVDGEGLAVQRHSEDQLVLGGALLDPVADGVVLWGCWRVSSFSHYLFGFIFFIFCCNV